ncbi:hypothetical protein VTN96DRAFT_7287 [Rasamsonia emersonii]
MLSKSSPLLRRSSCPKQPRRVSGNVTQPSMRCETSQNHKSIQSNGMDRREMHDDLAICSPTVLGFCLDKKLWDERSYQWDSVELGLSAGLREFAVENVEEIRFTESPFDMLIIPGDKKRSSNLSPRAVSARQMKQGQGVIILLHGPPGVGKTLKAIAERIKRPPNLLWGFKYTC